MEKEQIIDIIKNLNPQIKKKYNAEVKAIFGSYVWGDETDKSDLDILVKFNENANLLHLIGLSQFLEDDKTSSAVIRKFEIIGEATKNLPNEIKTEYPDIPWREMA